MHVLCFSFFFPRWLGFLCMCRGHVVPGGEVPAVLVLLAQCTRTRPGASHPPGRCCCFCCVLYALYSGLYDLHLLSRRLCPVGVVAGDGRMTGGEGMGEHISDGRAKAPSVPGIANVEWLSNVVGSSLVIHIATDGA